MFNACMAIAGTVGIPVAKMLFAKLDAAEKKASESKDALSDYKLHVANSYVSLERFQGFEEAIFKKLDRIEIKLDDKADK